jgi:hypothetical protein
VGSPVRIRVKEDTEEFSIKVLVTMKIKGTVSNY